MSDFASAAMLRLIQLGMKRQGIALGGLGAPRGAHVPLADKRALLEYLLREHGAQALLRIGEGLRDARDEPTSLALTMARDPLDLIERFQRLERFIHSRHRVLIEQSGGAGLVLRHVSLDPGLPPSAAEDLLVFGMLVALIEQQGVDGLQARFVTDAHWRWQRGRWIERALPKDVSGWALSWSPTVHPPVAPPAAEQNWVDAGHRRLAADPGRGWTLQVLARDMNSSPRSLQRRLLAGQSSFSALLMQVRLAQSAKLLTQSQQPPAEIAYVCGFADQAHFNRAFKRHVALTPVKFRQQFAAMR